jgi:hypothetical protein
MSANNAMVGSSTRVSSEYSPGRVSDHDFLREGREVPEAAPGSLKSAEIFGSSTGRSFVMTLQTME